MKPVKINIETALKIFADRLDIIEQVNKSKDGFVWVEFMTNDEYKSNAQNKLFHSLLTVFYRSGCSSFANFDELKRYYKKMAGLIEYKFQNNLKQETKSIVWKAIKLLPLPKEEVDNLVELLKGKIEVEKSWGSVKKKDAQIAIDRLLDDMNTSGVIGSSEGKKYDNILKGIGEL
jgi:hypothetical protein